jgi:hypothetical protein
MLMIGLPTEMRSEKWAVSASPSLFDQSPSSRSWTLSGDGADEPCAERLPLAVVGDQLAVGVLALVAGRVHPTVLENAADEHPPGPEHICCHVGLLG